MVYTSKLLSSSDAAVCGLDSESLVASDAWVDGRESVAFVVLVRSVRGVSDDASE